MSRYGDTGPYSVTNVFIQLATENTKQGIISVRGPTKESTKQLMSQAKKGKLKIKSSCITCKSVVSINNINKHYISCQKKALRRGLS